MSLNIIREFKTKTSEQVGKECFDIAIANNFIDDFDAFFAHIFGNPDFQRFFLTDIGENINGFSVIELNTIREFIICYIGIVFLHPTVQGNGFSKHLMSSAIDTVISSGIHPDLLALRTHNPRMYASFVSTFGSEFYFPNSKFETPSEVIGIIRDLPCSKDLDGDLITRNVYPNEFVQQTSSNEFSNILFSKLGPTDAVIPAIVLNPNKVLQKSLKLRS